MKRNTFLVFPANIDFRFRNKKYITLPDKIMENMLLNL